MAQERGADRGFLDLTGSTDLSLAASLFIGEPLKFAREKSRVECGGKK